MVALPFYYLTLRATKPRNPAYPEHMESLGDHLRQRRLDLRMHQKDVARIVNVSTSTVTNWEKNRTTPRLHFLPKIYEFLGGNPVRGNATSLGEILKQYRIQKGLSMRRLATELGVDPGTLAKWEKGYHEPRGKLKELMNSFLEIQTG